MSLFPAFGRKQSTDMNEKSPCHQHTEFCRKAKVYGLLLQSSFCCVEDAIRKYEVSAGRSELHVPLLERGARMDV